MASFTKAIAAGNAKAFLAFIDSNGFMIGSAITAPAQAAAGSAMTELTGIKAAAPTVPERELVQITGDDDLLGEFDFSSLTSRSFVVEIATQDLELEAKLLGTTVQTVGEAKIGAYDVDSPAELNVCLILQSRAKKYSTGSIGQKGWNGVIVPMATAQPLGRDGFNERGAAVYRLQITPQKASNFPWGITITTANVGKTNPRFLPFNTEYPVTMHAHTGTGALSTFTLDYQPVSAAKTATYSARVAQTVTSVSTSAPYSVTISGTPIGGAQLVTFYEFQS